MHISRLVGLAARWVAFLACGAIHCGAELVALEEGGEWTVEQVKASGPVANAVAADAVLAGTAPSQYRQKGRTRYLDFRDGSPMGLFGIDAPFLDGAGNDDFVVRATGKIRVLRAGQVTFAVGSDDGFRLRIDGVEVGSAGVRGFGHTPVVTSLTEGLHTVEVMMWERTGAAGLEVLVAREAGAWNTVSLEKFRLLPAAPEVSALGNDRVNLRPGGNWEVRERWRSAGATRLETLEAAEALFSGNDGRVELALDPAPRTVDLWRAGDAGVQTRNQRYPSGPGFLEDSAVRVRGRVYVERAGWHTFALHSSPMARLRVNGRVVVENGVGDAGAWNDALSGDAPDVWWRFDAQDARAGVVTNHGSAAGYLGTVVRGTLGVAGALGAVEGIRMDGAFSNRVDSSTTDPISGAATFEYLLTGEAGGNAQALHDDGVTSIRIEQWDNTGELGFTRYGVADYRFSPAFTGATRTPEGRWSHLVFVRGDEAGAPLTAYLDGRWVGTLQANHPLPVARLGSRGITDAYSGTIDEVAIYRRALDEARIGAHFRAFERARPGGTAVGSIELTMGWHEIEVIHLTRPEAASLEVGVARQLGRFEAFDPALFRPLEVSLPDPEGVGSTFTVRHTRARGEGSLEHALTELAATPPSLLQHVIDLSGVRGRIVITNELPLLQRNVLLKGPGEHLLTVSGGRSNRILWARGGTVEVRDLTLAEGWAAPSSPAGAGGGGAAGLGGAIFVDVGARVVVDRVTFSENRAVGGPGGRESTKAGAGGSAFGAMAGASGNDGASAATAGANGSGRDGIDGQPGGAGNAGAIAGSGKSGTESGAGGGAGGSGGAASRGGHGDAGRNASPNRNALGTFTSWNVAGDGGNGGRGGVGGGAGAAGHGEFAGGGGGGGRGGRGGNGGNGGAGGNGDSVYQFPVGTLTTPAGASGIAGAGGNGGVNGRGGDGGFGGGAGLGGQAGGAGSNGSGRNNSTSGTAAPAAPGGRPGAYGGSANVYGGGAGAGLGGAIFVREGGALELGRTRFLANVAEGGRPLVIEDDLTAGEAGQGKGGAIFAMDGASVVLQRYPELAGNGASSAYGVSGDQGALFGVPEPDIDLAAFEASRQAVYYRDAPIEKRGQAALRYVDLLYQDVGTPRPVYGDMGSWYGNAERDALVRELTRVWSKVREYPTSREWREHLLDLHFHRAQAEAILGDNGVGVADEGRILPPPAGTETFAIREEIARLTEALAHYERALDGWFELLAQPEGLEIFRTEAPHREMHSATYLEISSGLPRRVSPDFPAPGATGYRDLILAFDLLVDFGTTAVELSEMLVGDGRVASESTREQISHWLRQLKVRGQVLISQFPNLEPDDERTPGLSVAMRSWRETLSRLVSLQQTARGESNLLGLTDDFLLLLPRDSFDTTAPFDSFDRFKLLLDPADASGRLGVAVKALREAETEYRNYEAQRFEFEAQREALMEQYQDRLDELGDPQSQGSLIAQQLLSIELAKAQIRRNGIQIRNLSEEIQIEVQRNAREKGINLSIQNVKLRYRGMIAELDVMISVIEGTQKAADNFADSMGLDFGFGAKLANGVYQYAAEASKGLLRQEQSRLAGEEEMKITERENERLDVNSAALIQTRLLEMRTLSVDSQTAALVLAQEAGRLVALQEERRELLGRLESVDRKLNSRYFADPGHRLRAQRTTVLADQLFEDVQPWLFFMARALEYKFNQPFQQRHAGRDWTRASVFQCRNARELELLWQAMRNFDQDAMLNRSGLKDRYDWFSVREDFFGYRLGVDDAGQPLRYADPVTGESVDAITAFRSHMRQLMDARGRVTLPFSTVREIPLPVGTFFLGPEFLASGALDPSRKGLYLDKIKWMKIRLPGAHTTTGNTLVGTLAYGGTSFIRNAQVGTYDPQRPDELEDELTAYGTRVWRRNSEGRWVLEEQPETAIVVMVKEGGVRPDGLPAGEGQEPDILRSASRIDHFAERSVAASNWSLVFDTVKPNPVNQNDKALRLDQLDDVEIYFYHYTANRN